MTVALLSGATTVTAVASSRSRRRSSPCSPRSAADCGWQPVPAVIAFAQIGQTSRSFWKVRSPGRGTRCGPKSPAPRSLLLRVPLAAWWSSAIGLVGIWLALCVTAVARGSSWPCSAQRRLRRARSDDGGDSHHSAHRLWQRRQLRGRGEGRAVVPGARRRTRRHHAPGAAGRCSARRSISCRASGTGSRRGACTGGRGPRRRHRPPRAGGVDRGHFFVAPDNGLLSFLPADAHFVGLPDSGRRRAYLPSARRVRAGGGQLALGAPLSHVGRPSPRCTAPAPRPHHDGTVLIGEVIYVDRFGTLISKYPRGPGRAGCAHQGRRDEIGTLARTFGMWDGAAGSPSSAAVVPWRSRCATAAPRDC